MLQDDGAARYTLMPEPPKPPPCDSASHWSELAARVLDDHRLTADEGLAILRSGDEELLELLAAAYRVRRRWWGDGVKLNFLINAKSGHCSEDCGYCAQSRVSKAEIPRYRLVTADEIREGARIAAEQQAGTYCAVISGRSPSDAELDTLTQVIPEVKAAYGLKICFSVGLLSLEQARRLKQAGVDRINHNLNTSERFYPRICTTHCIKIAWPRWKTCGRRDWKSARAESWAWAKRTPTWSIWPCGSGSCRPRRCRSISCCRFPASAEAVALRERGQALLRSPTSSAVPAAKRSLSPSRRGSIPATV